MEATYQDKPNTGVLFKNTNKTEDFHGDYQGSWIAEDGTEYYLNAYLKESKAGNKYLKVVRGKVKGQPAAKPAPAPAAAAPDFDDDDMPF